MNTVAGSGFDMADTGAGEDAVLTIQDTSATPVEYGTVTITGGSSAQEAVDAINNANIEGISAFVNDDGEIQILSAVGDIEVHNTTGAGGNTLGFGAAATPSTSAADSDTLADVSVATVAGSNFAIARVDSALTTVNGLRGTLGAIQNRFESTIVNLQTVSENLAASRGRIEDADFAAETASLTKAQVLQQAGVSVLAQANAQPQLALSLLQ